jgi:hypothetical protein
MELANLPEDKKFGISISATQLITFTADIESKNMLVEAFKKS